MENENNIFDELMQDMLGVEEESNNTTDENTTEEPKKYIVPITEEIVYRGLLYKRLKMVFIVVILCITAICFKLSYNTSYFLIPLQILHLHQR